MKYIQLTQGKQAIVDDADYDMLMEKKWHYVTTGYARHNWKEDGHSRYIYMHSLLMNTPKGMETDHINQDKLDNRRANLRVVTSAQNKWNVGKQAPNTSGYKGVTWNYMHKKWYVRIRVDGQRVSLGYYISLQEAAKAYRTAELKYHGGFVPTRA